MKELSIEEKAKRYDEAINTAKKFYTPDSNNVNLKATLEMIFPELAGSEDEMIKKEIISFVEQAIDAGYGIIDKERKDKWIAWLEKQGEKKSFDDIAKEVTKDKDAAISFLKSTGIMNENGKLADEYKIEQGEQQPADKVKPKFKVGDWIVTNKNHIWNVDETPETTSYLYRLINQYGKVEVAEFEVVDKKARLWTIQDAMDGDILCCESGWTCIFKTLVNNETFSSYCFMDKTKWFCETGSECHTLKEEFIKAYNCKIYPATKEQRDTLEKAMTDAGYTFDFEKKELKKIEQKQEWSEEDKDAIDQAILALEDLYDDECPLCRYDGYKLPYDKAAKRLKSLKDRYTWKPSKEHIEALEKVLKYFHMSKARGETIDGLKELLEQLLEQLKRLREE